ncbi:hypothetical protein SY88_17290 [Clostridiales bacterium PH28_bin88]|nr:hypothetical protein SY88_17290 [Clostridiales bacterium PH28_bin88]
MQEYLDDRLSHIERVSQDIFEGKEKFIAVTLYEQYFFRAKNRAALMVIVESQGPAETRVKSVSCGSSEGILFNFDWGAADAFASEPIKVLQERDQIEE